MEKQLKDYLHLYLGCDVDTSGWAGGGYAEVRILTYVDKERNVAGIGFYYPNYINCEQSQLLELPIKDIKPILRPSSDMTQDEKRQYYSIESPSPSFERTALEAAWLFEHKFDVFGWIKTGRAIDATKTKAERSVATNGPQK